MPVEPIRLDIIADGGNAQRVVGATSAALRRDLQSVQQASVRSSQQIERSQAGIGTAANRAAQQMGAAGTRMSRTMAQAGQASTRAGQQSAVGWNRLGESANRGATQTQAAAGRIERAAVGASAAQTKMGAATGAAAKVGAAGAAQLTAATLTSSDAILKGADAHKKITTAEQQHGSRLKALAVNTRDTIGGYAAMARSLLVLGGAFKAYQFAKSAVTTTIQLSAATRSLQAVTHQDTRTASQWVEVAKVRGVEGKQLGAMFTRLSTNIRSAHSGTNQAAKAFQQLHLPMRQIQGQRLDKTFLQIADAMKKYVPENQRAAVAQQLFGRSGRSLLPILNQGSAGIQRALAMAHRYGAELGGPAAANTDKFRDAGKQMQLAMDGLKITLGNALIPALTHVIDWFNKTVVAMREGKGAAGALKDAVGGLGPVFEGAATHASKYTTALGHLHDEYDLLTRGSDKTKASQIGYQSAIDTSPVLSMMRAIDKLVDAYNSLYEVQTKTATGTVSPNAFPNAPRAPAPNLAGRREGGYVFQGGGMVPGNVSPGEIVVGPDGGMMRVPGQPTARDAVPMMLPFGGAVLTRSGQEMVRQGASVTQAVAQQAPHFAAGGRVTTATMFGGPNDPHTGHQGYKGDDLRRIHWAYAELGYGSRLGGQPYRHKMMVSRGRNAAVAGKYDIGGSANDASIDLWWELANYVHLPGKGSVRVQDVPARTPLGPVRGGSVAAAAGAVPTPEAGTPGAKIQVPVYPALSALADKGPRQIEALQAEERTGFEAGRQGQDPFATDTLQSLVDVARAQTTFRTETLPGTAGQAAGAGGDPFWRTKVVAWARSQLGRREGVGMNRTLGHPTIGDSQPWCGWFAEKAWKQGGVGPTFGGYVPNWESSARRQGMTTRRALPGNVVTFGGRHMGIIATGGGGTIEGNHGNMVARGSIYGRGATMFITPKSGIGAAAGAAGGGGSGVFIRPMHTWGPITGGFHENRGDHLHDGVDIAVGRGTRIYSPAPGTVNYAGWNNGYGNYVRVAHPGGAQTFYGHLQSVGVRSGQRVRQGQYMGSTDNTGSSRGDHLHWGGRLNGRAIDPRSLLGRRYQAGGFVGADVTRSNQHDVWLQRYGARLRPQSGYRAGGSIWANAAGFQPGGGIGTTRVGVRGMFGGETARRPTFPAWANPAWNAWHWGAATGADRQMAAAGGDFGAAVQAFTAFLRAGLTHAGAALQTFGRSLATLSTGELDQLEAIVRRRMAQIRAGGILPSERGPLNTLGAGLGAIQRARGSATGRLVAQHEAAQSDIAYRQHLMENQLIIGHATPQQQAAKQIAFQQSSIKTLQGILHAEVAQLTYLKSRKDSDPEVVKALDEDIKSLNTEISDANVAIVQAQDAAKQADEEAKQASADNTGAVTDNTKAQEKQTAKLEEANRLLQEQNELLKREATKAHAETRTAESQLDLLTRAVAGMANRGLGGLVGLNKETPGTPGRLASVR